MILALAHVVDTGEAQRAERMGDRAALRIEHAGLQGDVNARLHLASFCYRGRHCIVAGPFMSLGPPSGRMPSRRATSW